MRIYTVTKADPEADREDVLSVLKRNLDGNISEQRYIWKYIHSPAGYALCCLVKEEDSDQYVGSGALFPRRIFIEGKAVYGAIAGDLAVDKGHRTCGPALMLQKTIQKSLKDNNYELIYGIPNPLAESLFLRAGYMQLGHCNTYVKLLKAEYKSGKYLPPESVTKIFQGIINFGFKILSRENRYRRPSGISVEIPDRFDERFDVLWTRVSQQFHVIGERDSRFLNWRYKQSPYKNYAIFSLVHGEREVMGYIVYCIEENGCHIADMLFNSGEVMDALLAEFCLDMTGRGIGSISIRYFGNQLLREKLKEFNFFLNKKIEEKLLVYFDQTSPFASVLLDAENWYFLEGDTDMIYGG